MERLAEYCGGCCGRGPRPEYAAWYRCWWLSALAGVVVFSAIVWSMMRVGSGTGADAVGDRGMDPSEAPTRFAAAVFWAVATKRTLLWLFEWFAAKPPARGVSGIGAALSTDP